jgi:DNA replicative helicase MCM subunit Mcm2 (Cdc46/Mcm family)
MVRHLEGMIRSVIYARSQDGAARSTAEASAKMHLREYVRADDVDLAISVAVGSF